MFGKPITLKILVTGSFFLGIMIVLAPVCRAQEPFEVLNQTISTSERVNSACLSSSVSDGSLIDSDRKFFGQYYPPLLEPQSIEAGDPLYLKMMFRQYRTLLQLAGDAANLSDDSTQGWTQILVENIIPSKKYFNYPLFADDIYVKVIKTRNSLIKLTGKGAVVLMEKSLLRRAKPLQIIGL